MMDDPATAGTVHADGRREPFPASRRIPWDLHPSNGIKLTWGLLQSAIAAVLLMAGGLEGLQTASIIAAAPFALIMLLVCASLFRALQEEGRERRAAERDRPHRVDALLAREAGGAGGASPHDSPPRT